MNQRKGNACYIVAESLAILSPVVKWKLSNMSSLLSYLNKGISRQNVEDDTWFFLPLIVKCKRQEIT